MVEENIIFAIISVVISIGLFIIAKVVIQSKLPNLKGSSKLLGIIFLVIITLEAGYLGIDLGWFNVATEVIATIGVGFFLVTFAIQNHLKNIVSGIGLYLNKNIIVGDFIEIDGTKAQIIEFHLMRTVAKTGNEKIVYIPNLTFSESVILISKD
ncbi:MAG: mechanosensitive ion channel domain-containing protein [Nitrosopumilaceae archaeon]